MGFLGKKSIRKVTHIGVKSQRKINHVGKKIVNETPEAMVRTGQTLTDIGGVGEEVGKVAMAVNPELGMSIIQSSKYVEQGGTALKSGGRALKKARRGDMKGAVKQANQTAQIVEGGNVTLSKKSQKAKKPSVQKETKPTMSSVPQSTSSSRMSYENFA